MECINCKQEFEDKGYCKMCYLNLQGDIIRKLMEGDVPTKISEAIRDISWKVEDEIKELNDKIDNLTNILKSLKERGFKVKK